MQRSPGWDRRSVRAGRVAHAQDRTRPPGPDGLGVRIDAHAPGPPAVVTSCRCCMVDRRSYVSLSERPRRRCSSLRRPSRTHCGGDRCDCPGSDDASWARPHGACSGASCFADLGLWICACGRVGACRGAVHLRRRSSDAVDREHAGMGRRVPAAHDCVLDDPDDPPSGRTTGLNHETPSHAATAFERSSSCARSGSDPDLCVRLEMILRTLHMLQERNDHRSEAS